MTIDEFKKEQKSFLNLNKWWEIYNPITGYKMIPRYTQKEFLANKK